MSDADALRPPVDVRLVYDDGTQLAVQTVFDGIDRSSGTYRWRVVDARPGEVPVAVLIGQLPGMTTIVVPGLTG